MGSFYYASEVPNVLKKFTWYFGMLVTTRLPTFFNSRPVIPQRCFDSNVYNTSLVSHE